MRGLALLLARELRRRLPVHLVSIGLALAAVAAPWLVGSSGDARAFEIRGMVAVVVSMLWSFTIALIEGFTCLAGDLRERRLAFDFRLPVGSTAIWSSRLLAGIASVAAAAAIPQLGAAAAGADLEWAGRTLLDLPQSVFAIELASPVGTAALLLLAVLFSLDLVGVAFASRGPWLALDFVAVILFKSLAFLAILSLWRATAESTSGRALAGAIVVALLAMLVATWQQMARGRTEPDRAHRAFSLTFAPTALALVVPILIWSSWFLSPSGTDLIGERTKFRPLNENLVWLSGPARGRGEVAHQFLFEPLSKRFLLLGTQHASLSDAPAKVSLDGSTIAWTDTRREGLRSWSSRLRVASGTNPFSGSRPSGVVWDGFPWSWALSLDGSRVASVWRSGEGQSWPHLQVEDVDTGRVLSQLSLRNCADQGPLLFLDSHRLVYGCGISGNLTTTLSAPILLIDLETRAVEATGVTSLAQRPVDIAFARARDRWFQPPAEDAGAGEARPGVIHRTGTEPISISPPGDAAGTSGVVSARFLSNGGLAVAWKAEPDRVLAFYDSTGVLQSTRSMPAEEIDLLAELPGALLVLTLRYEVSRIPTPTLLRVPLDGGTISEIEQGVYPVRPESASTPTTVFYRPRGERLWLDLSTGRLVPLFAAF